MLIRPLVRAASTSASSSAASSSTTLAAYLLLSRPPTILRSPTSFETAYHAYNSKLQEALSQPFPREVYFKKGSAAENKFNKEEEERRKVLFGDQKEQLDSEKKSSTTKEKETSVAAEVSEIEGQDLYRTLPRRTKADEENRTDSLDRSLDRNLFMVVRGGEMGTEWTLPFTKIEKGGNTVLHKTAPQMIHSLFGKEIDIWIVSNMPIGLLSGGAGSNQKGYVMSGHILAGQPDASLSKGVEYAWLTKEEIKDRVAQEHWTGIQDLLST
ncbi:hypothetical protein CBS101457_006526 [Exobasidium rhododendri]|nr:hypothetical protein CBS101457_006526 [Exobasidium rhododendri]